MKLITYSDDKGDTYGIANEDNIVNIGRALYYPNIRTLLEAEALGEAHEYAAGRDADALLSEVTLLSPIQNPDKIIMVGLNYATHVAEGGRDTPEYPMLFPRYANTQVGHGQPMIRPKVSERFDFEGELAFVVSKGGRYVAKEDAYDHVAVYACYNDASVRD